MKEPEKYGGDDGHEVFVNWLDSFLNWLRSQQISGPELDSYMLDLLPRYLEGDALEWFMQTFDSPDRQVHKGTFTGAICATHKHFVKLATAKKAVKDFEACSYKRSQGIKTFYNQLDKFARRMVEYPTDYTIRARLLDGLPSWMYNELTVHRGVTAEYSTI